jgi:hypothetical protein
MQGGNDGNSNHDDSNDDSGKSGIRVWKGMGGNDE